MPHDAGRQFCVCAGIAEWVGACIKNKSPGAVPGDIYVLCYVLTTRFRDLFLLGPEYEGLSFPSISQS